MANVYQRNNFKDRAHYLTCLADDNDVDIELVLQAAELLGQEEDFDGLVSIIQDL